MVVSQLLCKSTHWNPPGSTEDSAIVVSVDWLRVPVDHLKSRLSKVDMGVIKACCNLYVSPNETPKSKTGRYGIIAKRFQSRSLFLFHASDVEVLKSYFALTPYNPPALEASHCELVERILRGEFGHEISDQLLLPPSSERQDEKKEICHSNWKCSIADVCASRDQYIRLWPQLVPKDVLMGCLNTYYEATQLQIPLVCCVCSRQQFDVETCEIMLSTRADLPDYFSTLEAMSPSLHNEFTFLDLHFDGLALDPNGIETNTGTGDTKLSVCCPCYVYLTWGSMPCFALANKLYRGCLPEEFLDLTWIEECVCQVF